MTTDELAEATKAFDEPYVIDQSKPLSPARRAVWERLSQKQKPTAVHERKRVSVSIEKHLLDRVTALAKERGISRSKLVATALEEALARHH
jgi:hypothetical protein